VKGALVSALAVRYGEVRESSNARGGFSSASRELPLGIIERRYLMLGLPGTGGPMPSTGTTGRFFAVGTSVMVTAAGGTLDEEAERGDDDEGGVATLHDAGGDESGLAVAVGDCARERLGTWFVGVATASSGGDRVEVAGRGDSSELRGEAGGVVDVALVVDRGEGERVVDGLADTFKPADFLDFFGEGDGSVDDFGDDGIEVDGEVGDGDADGDADGDGEGDAF
jgi:hypothetical protein